MIELVVPEDVHTQARGRRAILRSVFEETACGHAHGHPFSGEWIHDTGGIPCKKGFSLSQLAESHHDRPHSEPVADSAGLLHAVFQEADSGRPSGAWPGQIGAAMAKRRLIQKRADIDEATLPDEFPRSRPGSCPIPPGR